MEGDGILASKPVTRVTVMRVFLRKVEEPPRAAHLTVGQPCMARETSKRECHQAMRHLPYAHEKMLEKCSRTFAVKNTCNSIFLRGFASSPVCLERPPDGKVSNSVYAICNEAAVAVSYNPLYRL